MLFVITGSSRGIGFEMVKFLAKNPENLILAVSRNIPSVEKLIREKKLHSVLPIKADITKPADQKKIAATIKKLGLPVDVLVNNAGELINKPFSKISLPELHSVYTTNVFAPFMLIQQLLPLMNTKKRSHIVNIGSMGGYQGSAKFAGLSAYTSSKSALAGLTECLAEEFKQTNISVNCLAIGSVQTEMLSKAFPGYKAPTKPNEMAEFICNFATTGQHYFNGKILPVSSTTP
jgi:3-oxoacyl-[acyl-carrier protein] reductase